MSIAENGYRDILKDDKELLIFLRTLKQFDAEFCRVMNGKLDYTLKLEVHGAAGKLVHCRMTNDSFDRPVGTRPVGRMNQINTQ